jgi:hypothetical protein
VNRLPDIELLATGGTGAPMLAASYAPERGLTCTALVPEFVRFPEAATVERRDAKLAAEADAAVIVWDERDPATRELRALIEAKELPVHVLGEPAKSPKARRVRDPEAPGAKRHGMLPDCGSTSAGTGIRLHPAVTRRR